MRLPRDYQMQDIGNQLVNVTVDLFTSAALDGRAFKMNVSDTTGLEADGTLFFFLRNDHAGKVLLKAPTFTVGSFMTQVSVNGSYEAESVEYNPNEYVECEVEVETTEASTSITGTFDTDIIKEGMLVSGPGIPDGTTVVTVGADTLVLSNAATETSEEPVTITIELPQANVIPLGGGEHNVKVWEMTEDIEFAGTVDVTIDEYPTSEYILQPGDEVMIAFTNTGEATAPYSFDIEWAEI